MTDMAPSGEFNSENNQVLLLEQHPIRVSGQSLKELPHDLYIPPDALEVFLEAFSGPLDLLLYLIRKQNLDIVDIPIARITNQYMEYVELMKSIRLELAADYLVMAATLAEIKSRMLLPRSSEEEDDDDFDPRAELVRRLQEYEQIKVAAEHLNQLPYVGKDIFTVQAHIPDVEPKVQEPELSMQELVGAFLEVLKRSELIATHKIQMEPLSVREKMSGILNNLRETPNIRFEHLFSPEEGRLGIVVTFIAILELLKEFMIQCVQAEPFGPIHIKAITHENVEETVE